MQTHGVKMDQERLTNVLIVRLGGLHTAMSFVKVIGKHIQSSGLQEAWVESNLTGPNAA